jgi:hypothetical protein
VEGNISNFKAVNKAIPVLCFVDREMNPRKTPKKGVSNLKSKFMVELSVKPNQLHLHQLLGRHK